MPSLRIASIGASIASARTILARRAAAAGAGIGICRPTIGAIRKSASSTLASFGVEHRQGAVEARTVERELG